NVDGGGSSFDTMGSLLFPDRAFFLYSVCPAGSLDAALIIKRICCASLSWSSFCRGNNCL
ncbi:hypothetical protein A2U01_0041661, partial [Trifolium medium]|nr:hypothetical protein [Trifolium medium]